MNGSSSTPETVTNDACRVVEAGVDTIRVVCERGPRSGPLPRAIAGYRVLTYSDGRRIALEGRPGGDRVCRAGELPETLRRMAAVATDAGIGGSVIGIARIDAAVTLEFADPSQGALTIAAVAALGMPRCEIVARPAVRPRSVALKHPNGTRTLGRVYCKASERRLVEKGVARFGELVRFEDQRRYSGASLLDLAVLQPSEIRRLFQKRWSPLTDTGAVRVAGLSAVMDDALERFSTGEFKDFRDVERRLGYLAAVARGIDPGYSASTMQRRRRELRGCGLVLGDDLVGSVAVNLGRVGDQLMSTEIWEMGVTDHGGSWR